MPLSKRDISIFILLTILYGIVAILFYRMAPMEVGWDYYSWKSIAVKYSNGHFKEALNAYWSPLVSWLMIPLVKFNLFNDRENFAINLFASIPLLLLSFKITSEQSIVGAPKYLFILSFFLFAIGLPVLFYDFCDFLASVVFIAYVIFITSPKLVNDKKYYLASGTVAVLCTFGKSFYTSYVILSLVLLIAYHYFFQRGKNGYLLQNLSKSLLMVLVAVVVWAGLLSWKYDKFMLNSSGSYNFAIAGPNGFNPHFRDYGLYPPPDVYSYHNWVDPTYYPIVKRKVFKDYDSLMYQWGIFKYNFRIVLYSFSFFSYLKFFVLLLIIPVLFIRNRRTKEKLFFYILSSLAVIAGYFLVLIEERYFLGAQILLFIFSYITVYKFLSEANYFKHSIILLNVSLILITCSFMKINYFSVKEWLTNRKDEHIEKMLGYERKIAQLPFIKSKRIATSFGHNGLDDLTCFEIWRGAHTINYGNLGKFDSFEEQYEDLKKYDIDYFLYYGCSRTDAKNDCINTELPFYLKSKAPVYIDKVYGVSIYAMKPYKE